MKKRSYKLWWLALGFIGVIAIPTIIESIIFTDFVRSAIYDFPIDPVPISDVEAIEDIESEEIVEVTEVYDVDKTVENENLRVTLDSIEVFGNELLGEKLEGKVYAEVLMTVENKIDKDFPMCYLYDCEARVDNEVVKDNMLPLLVSKNEYFAFDLKSGEKLQGALWYEIPKDWSELEIDCNFDYVSGDTLTLSYNKE